MNRATMGSFYDGVTERLNDVTGGSKYQRGYVDVSPETMKYWTQSLLGGAGKFVFDTAGIVTNLGRGVTPQDFKDVPVVRRFVREGGVSDARTKFYDLKNESDIAIGEYKAALKNKDGAAALELKQENGELFKLAKLGQRLVRAANAKRDMVVDVRNDDGLTMKEKQLKIKQIEKEEEALYNKLLSVYKERVESRNEAKR